MDGGTPVVMENSENSKWLASLRYEFIVFRNNVRKFFNKWWNEIFITFSFVAFAIPPIWYSAWFPDAQQALYQEMQNNQKEEKEKNSIKKPGFFQVSFHHVNDFSAPPPWLLIFTLIYILAQVKQFKITEENIKLKAENIDLIKDKSSVKSDMDKLNTEFEDYKIKAREELSDEKLEHYDTRKHYSYSVKQELQNFFTQHKWFDENYCRFSLYTFDKNFSSANLIHRYCIISRLEKAGRLSISAKDGVIAAALNNGDSVWVKVIKHSKKDNKKYEAAIRKCLSENYGVTVSDETFKNVRMKPSVYYCRSIRRQNGIDLGKFAVFVIESENPEAFTEEMLNQVFSQKMIQIHRMVDHLSRLEAVMNPTKEAA